MPYNPNQGTYIPPGAGGYDPNMGTYQPPAPGPQPAPYPYNIPQPWRPPVQGPQSGPGIEPQWPGGGHQGPAYQLYPPPPAYGAPVQPQQQYGGGGGGGGPAWERAGMTEELATAYKDFWGSDVTDEYAGIHPQVSQMFANYFNRPPRLGDWKRLWTANKLAYTRAGETEGVDEPYQDVTAYDPLVAHFAPSPQLIPPPTAYQPDASF